MSLAAKVVFLRTGSCDPLKIQLAVGNQNPLLSTHPLAAQELALEPPEPGVPEAGAQLTKIETQVEFRPIVSKCFRGNWFIQHRLQELNSID